MNNLCLSTAIALLSTLLFSCVGQTQEHTINKPSALAGAGLNDPQIAEYVVDVFEDRSGNLWFGTMSKGVGRYDGTSFRYFTVDDGLCGNTISSITEDRFGRIWFGGHDGLCYYDPSLQDTEASPSIKVVWRTSGRHDQGSGWASIRSDRHGHLWASSTEGIFKYDPIASPSPDSTSFIPFKVPLPPGHPSSYAITPGRTSLKLEDRAGNLWFSADGYGVIKYDVDRDTFSYFTKNDGLCSNNINSIVEDDAGYIWFSCMQSYQPYMTGDGGVCRYDPKASANGTSPAFTSFKETPGLHKNDIYTLFVDSRGRLWIGASGLGVYCYQDSSFNLITHTTRPDLLTRFGLQEMMEDRDGRLWLGFSGGLFRLEGESLINITQNGPWK